MKVIDTETNGGALDNNLTNIWAVGVYDSCLQQYQVFTEPDPLFNCLAASEEALIFHNAPFDLWVIQRFCGYLPPLAREIHDTMILDYLLDQSRPHSLEECAKRAGTFKMESPNFDELSDEMLEYLKQDVMSTWEVFQHLYPQLTYQLRHIYALEQAFLLPMTELNHNGMKTSIDSWKAALEQITIEREENREEILSLVPVSMGKTVITKRLRSPETVCTPDDLQLGKYVYQGVTDDGRHSYTLVVPFNPGSTTQRIDALQRLYGWEPTELTLKGAAKCDKNVLDSLDYPLARLLQKSQEVGKLYSTYGESLLEKIHSNGRIYTHFNGVVTLTGRLSSSEPNLQTIPSSGAGVALRGMFVADEGKVLIDTDLDQFQLRILAWYLLQCVGMGRGDVHAMVTDFNDNPKPDPHQVTADLLGVARHTGKTINFGVLFGMGCRKLARSLKISEREARTLLRTQTEKQPSIDELRRYIIEISRSNGGYVFSAFGRRGYYPDLLSKDGGLRSHAERQCFNFVIQGTESDLIKHIISKCYERSRHLHAKLVLQVHDEFIFEVNEIEAAEMRQIIYSVINIPKLLPGIKLSGTPKIGRNWYETHETQ